jgi:hypothetical protein
MADGTNTQCSKRTEDWNTLPWKDIQKNVFRLQRRIYQAASQNDTKRVHDLQRLLLRFLRLCSGQALVGTLSSSPSGDTG